MPPVRPIRALGTFAGVASLVVGCGTNNADVPAALLDAIKHPDIPDSGSSAYPRPPYGTDVGSVIQNLCFEGWRNPRAANFDPKAFEQICLSDFFDPKGETTKLLLLESCALWCTACKSEYGGSGNRPSLGAQLATRESEGFRVAGALFQGIGQKVPATASDAVAWAQSYDVAFPFLLDDKHLIGAFVQGDTAPFNMLIDTRTMKIVLEVAGDEPATIFGTVDNFFLQNASP